jgi:hypothetical protein
MHAAVAGLCVHYTTQFLVSLLKNFVQRFLLCNNTGQTTAFTIVSLMLA